MKKNENLTDWIDLNLSQIKSSLLYGMYFDTIGLEYDLDEYRLFNPQSGLEVVLRKDQSVKTIHFYSGKQEETSRFSGELPCSLNFSYSRDLTREILGPPQSSGGGEYSLIYGTAPYWDKYNYSTFILHIQFLRDFTALELITVYSPNEKY